MDKICILVQEILPLYKDKVCNQNCYKIIEEHLETCNDCKKQFGKINIDIDAKKENLKESMDMRLLSKKFKIQMIKNIMTGILIATIIFLIIYCFIDFRIF